MPQVMERPQLRVDALRAAREAAHMATEEPATHGWAELLVDSGHYERAPLSEYGPGLRQRFVERREARRTKGQMFFPDYGVPEALFHDPNPDVQQGLRDMGLLPGGCRYELLRPKPKGPLPTNLPPPVTGLPRWRFEP